MKTKAEFAQEFPQAEEIC